ncbi:hypothetical protein ACSBR1_007251 [Camellia fascicularis]
MVTRTVDLRSNTVTKPSQAIRTAMANAEVDDDVLGCDPTAFCLETELATITSNEAALFVPSGTMGISTIGGVHPRAVKNNRDGTMDIDLIEAAIRDPKLEICYPTTRLICLETTHANCGGKCLPVEYTDKVGELAKKHGLKLHIDGARIFNASVALGIPVHRLVQAADSVSVCLSKGLGAPAGTVIVGKDSKEDLRWWDETSWRCTATLVAVQENVGKLESDHNNAKFLARLNRIEGLKVDVNSVETNILYFDILEGTNITALKLCKNLEEHGILVIPESLSRIRLVLHYQISESDVQYTLYKNFGGEWGEEKGIAMKFPGFVASFYYVYYNLCFAQVCLGENPNAGGLFAYAIAVLGSFA